MLIAAVVVAYNRETLLREALEALLDQTRKLDAIVVIDNASTDNSLAVARETAPHATVIHLDRNTGGAGGFAAGIAVAIEQLNADLVWAMDDDTIPEPTALEELIAARDSVAPTVPAVLASRVVWHDGQDHPMNTPRQNPFASRKTKQKSAAVGLLPVRSASFVSLLVDAAEVKKVGLPIADYFIWNDDFEFTTRLLRHRIGLYAPKSVVVHKTKILASTDIDPGERFYYEVRNKLWLFRKSAGLSLVEKAVYGASSVRRWIRTFVRSENRAVLRAGFARGLADGIRTNPQPNSASFADLPEAAALQRAFEPSVKTSRGVN